LAVSGEQFESYGGESRRVEFGLVDYFERAVGGVVQVVAAFGLDGGAVCRVADAVIVVHVWVVDGEGHAFFDYERVGVAVNCWVYS
jgi:hypothetical protein